MRLGLVEGLWENAAEEPNIVHSFGCRVACGEQHTNVDPTSSRQLRQDIASLKSPGTKRGPPLTPNSLRMLDVACRLSFMPSDSRQPTNCDGVMIPIFATSAALKIVAACAYPIHRIKEGC